MSHHDICRTVLIAGIKNSIILAKQLTNGPRQHKLLCEQMYYFELAQSILSVLHKVAPTKTHIQIQQQFYFNYLGILQKEIIGKHLKKGHIFNNTKKAKTHLYIRNDFLLY